MWGCCHNEETRVMETSPWAACLTSQASTICLVSPALTDCPCRDELGFIYCNVVRLCLRLAMLPVTQTQEPFYWCVITQICGSNSETVGLNFVLSADMHTLDVYKRLKQATWVTHDPLLRIFRFVFPNTKPLGQTSPTSVSAALTANQTWLRSLTFHTAVNCWWPNISPCLMDTVFLDKENCS